MTKRFGDLIAVDRLSLNVRAGEIYGLVGPDGAGKTTTLRMLSSIMSPDSGTARVAGFDVRLESSAVKDNLAYMSQRFGLYVDLTVAENIAFYADLYGVPRKGRQERIDELLDFSSMRPFKKRRAGDLSGGMKQKLQLVCALVHTPRVLLLDEPTNGVDPVSRRDFWRILYRLLKQDVAILVTTAYLDEAERCNRVGLMDHGKLLVEGSPTEVKQLMDGKILTVRSPEARRVNQVLRTECGHLRTEVFGDTVHVVCSDPKQVQPEILTVLSRHDLAVGEMREEDPSLEDVFVSLLRKENEIEEGSALLTEPSPAFRHPFGKLRAGSSKEGNYFEFNPSDRSPPGRGGRRSVWVESGKEGLRKEKTPLSKLSEKTEGPPAVTVQGLTRKFGSFTAVRSLDFTVKPGEVFGFLGPNGAGKSTTIRMLCGLLIPTEGTGSVAGFDINADPEAIKRHIGYMSQKFSLYEDLEVEENIEFYGGIYGLTGERMRRRKEWAIEMAGLSDRRRSMTAILSGGWKQRLAMACAILHEPPIVFLDEPTSGVDPISRRKFWDLIYALSDSGVTVFVTTHYMEEAEYCDRLALIYRGGMIALGTPLELKSRMMKEHILDLHCAESQNVLEDLAALPGVREAALFGSGLHLVVEHVRKGEKVVREFLTSKRIEIERLEKINPSMEDVFVSLIEAEDRENAEAVRGLKRR